MSGPIEVQFGPVYLSRGIDFTFSPGVQPSVCMVYTVPHTQGLPNVGTLRFTLRGERVFTFRDCLLEAPQLDTGPQGAFWRLPLLDRRWKWQFAHIFGSYNIAKPDGRYLREKTPQELAALLLDALGESGYDVSRLPNDARPERRWETGAGAAGELDRLCAEMSCLVVLNWNTDRVEIWPIGTGAVLPVGSIEGRSYAPVQHATPEKIRVEAGNTLFQDTFTTEAVGLDVDDKWRPIDQLSYRPSAGWGDTWPADGFPGITGTYVSHGHTLNRRDLAEATVFRCYRITGLLRGGWVPSYLQLNGTPEQQPQSRKDIQLFDELADEEISLSDGGLRRLPAVAYVKYERVDKALMANPSRYPDGFSLDATQGIIHFNEPLYLRSSGNVIPATVNFECAFHAGRNGIMHRLNRESSLGGHPTPTRLISRPEVLLRSVQRYNASGAAGAEENNSADAIQRLDYWFNAALSEYRLQQGGTVRYAGFVPIVPDGLTLQVTWSGGGLRHASTIASQAQRHSRLIKPLEDYRDRLTAKRTEKQVIDMASQYLVRAIGGGVV